MSSILVVEDYGVVGDLPCRSFGESHRCEAVGSAEEAVRQMEVSGYDLLITDVGLRGMSGAELLIRARRERPPMPVIVIAGGG